MYSIRFPDMIVDQFIYNQYVWYIAYSIIVYKIVYKVVSCVIVLILMARDDVDILSSFWRICNISPLQLYVDMICDIKSLLLRCSHRDINAMILLFQILYLSENKIYLSLHFSNVLV